MSTYEVALRIATDAHKGQERWDGSDYINHPISVASFWSKNSNRAIVGLLHDTIEDHPDKVSVYSLSDAGFSEDIIDAIVLLTRDKKMPYLDYLLPLIKNDIARDVKIADLKHNLSCFPQKLDSYKRNQRDKYQLALYICQNYSKA